MPRVSAVIPTRDRPGLLPRAVESALAQSVDDVEVIVVLDGPDEAAAVRSLRDLKGHALGCMGLA